jgi:hypothetical protein
VTRALLYLRVSSDEQAREGVSLDEQLAEDQRYVAGPHVLGALTGIRDDQPGLRRATR